MIPFFTSDYSLGRSILKLKPTNGGPSDILTMAKEAELKEIFLVEDTMIGFLEAQNIFYEEGISLRFGARLNVCNDVEQDKKDSSFKIILFALNDEGCKELYNIFSEVHTHPNREGHLDLEILKSCERGNILAVHPFYDSYLFQNSFYFKNCMWVKMFDKEIYAWEDNKLPVDGVMRKNLSAYSENCEKVKTILYRHRSDVSAYQTYRMACNRSFGKSRGLSAPNLEHFGSNEFCFQSYMEEAHGRPFKI